MRIFLILVFFMFSSFVKADDGIQVSIKKKEGKADDTWIELNLKNISGGSICINSKIIGLDGGMGDQFFSIINKNKIAVKYFGVNAIDFDNSPGILMSKNQEISVDFNLSSEYKIQKGIEYEVSYAALSIGICRGKTQSVELRSLSKKIKF